MNEILSLVIHFPIYIHFYSNQNLTIPDRRQSKTLILSTNVDKNRERVFDCHLSHDWRHMAIENTVYSDFYPRSSIVMSVFDCRLSGVLTQ